MEGARQFQDRLLRDTNRRVGWAYAGGMRRSTDHSQILFDAARFRIRGATRHYGRGSRPRRTRGNCLARWTETQVIVAHRLRLDGQANKALNLEGLPQVRNLNASVAR